MTKSTSVSDGGNRSLLRGLAVLDCIKRHSDKGVRVSTLVKECELERATIYRLLSTLISCGYVKEVRRFHYVAANQIATSEENYLNEIANQLAPVLRFISEQTEDAAFATLREGTQGHCVARHIGTFPVQALTVDVGRRQPLGVGAAGLALLSSLGEAEASKIIHANSSALAAYGGMTPSRLELLLTATRERGWSVVGNHVVPDILAVGIFVPGLHGGVTAGISIAAPTLRMTPQRQRSVINIMRQAVKKFIQPAS